MTPPESAKTVFVDTRKFHEEIKRLIDQDATLEDLNNSISYLSELVEFKDSQGRDLPHIQLDHFEISFEELDDDQS